MGAYTFVPESSETFTSRDLVALDSDTGKMVCVATTDEYKEGLKYINELYNMGAIYDGDFTQTNAELKSSIPLPIMNCTAIMSVCLLSQGLTVPGLHGHSLTMAYMLVEHVSRTSARMWKQPCGGLISSIQMKVI